MSSIFEHNFNLLDPIPIISGAKRQECNRRLLENDVRHAAVKRGRFYYLIYPCDTTLNRLWISMIERPGEVQTIPIDVISGKYHIRDASLDTWKEVLFHLAGKVDKEWVPIKI